MRGKRRKKGGKKGKKEKPITTTKWTG